MNREIKFRAWDKTYKRMNYKVQVGNTDYADQNYTCNSIWVDYGDRKSIGWMNADEKCIDLMQFTGLIDKNGKEIYEGDFCIVPYLGDEKTRGVIEYKNGAFVFMSKENPSLQVVGWSMIKPSETEVVGNIFETPELLNF